MESGRIHQLVEDARRCDTARALAKLRATAGGNCKPCAATVTGFVVPPVKDASVIAVQKQECVQAAYQESTIKYANANRIQLPSVAMPAGIYTLMVDQRATECLSTEARFAEFSRVRPPPCPPITYTPFFSDASGNRIYYALGNNKAGNEPILQGTTCPLPNIPGFPVLPG